MIAKEPNVHGYHDLLYIDFEVAGYHSLILDLAKPLYNDVFFQTLMGDILTTPGLFKHAFHDEIIIIRVGGCTDDLSKAILEIRKDTLSSLCGYSSA